MQNYCAGKSLRFFCIKNRTPGKNLSMKWLIVLMLIAAVFICGLSDGGFFDKLPEGYEKEYYGEEGERRAFEVLGKIFYVSTEAKGKTSVEAAVYKGEFRPKKEEVAKIFRAAKIMTETGEGYIITYYYTPKLKNRIEDGSAFNLVVVETDEKTVVANGIYPGSF